MKLVELLCFSRQRTTGGWQMKMATSAVLAAGLALTLLIAATGCGSDSSTSTESGAAEDSEAEETTTTEQTTTTVDVEAAKAEVDAEVEAACAAVAADPTLDPETLVPIQKREWSAAGILSTAVEQRIQKCADEAVEAAFAAIEAAEAQAEAAAAANAGPADIDAIVKNPDALTGQFVRISTVITQMDAATGPCIYRGYWDNSPHQYNFDYEGDNAMFTTEDAVTATTTCPLFDGIDQDDKVNVTAKILGSYSYDTQIGGSTTVPLFQVVAINDITKG
jgi:hypothetical protein